MKGDAEEIARQISRIEGLVQQIAASSDPAAREAARDLTGTLLDVHRAALERVLSLLAAGGAEGRALLERCAEDEVIASALALHELSVPPRDQAPYPDRGLDPRGKGPGDRGQAAGGLGLVTLRLPRERSSEERCELCAADLSAGHRHLLSPRERRILCACDACAALFDGKDGRYLRVPRRVLSLDGFRMDDAQWDALSVPVHLAFFFHSSAAGRILSLYPSPAGAIEALLPLAAWDEIALNNPILREMEPDVEALLVHRIGAAREHFLCPIDRCFELAGIFRSHRGSILGRGQPGADGDLGRFLSTLRAEARCPT